ncbi:UNVERIFIED_CONTAM: hypothetical protein PYX00_008198 [Menopon gallinae]|uniref:Protein argonaute-2 n=1 Tax=Menopon gallinae TaxID=328185 RepID=A0AAW2HMN4_9NEOP
MRQLIQMFELDLLLNPGAPRGSPAPQPASSAPPPKPAWGSPAPQQAWGSPAPQPASSAPPPKPAWGSPAPQQAWGSPAPQPASSAPPPQPASSAPGGKAADTKKKKKPETSKPPSSVSPPTAAMSGLSMSHGGSGDSDLTVPSRVNKKGVKQGKELPVETNFLPITMKYDNLTAYQYDVEIEPDKPKYMLRLVWNEFVRRKFKGRNPSYDGRKIAVSARPLMNGKVIEDSFQVCNPENEKMKDFKVTLKLASEVQLANLKKFLESKDLYMNLPMAELAVLDIVLRNYASNRLIRAGRSFFPLNERQPRFLGGGMNCHTGYYQSAILGWKLYLNIDVSHKGFPHTDILKAIEEICLTDYKGNVTRLTEHTTIDRYGLEKLNKHVKGLKVQYMLPNDQGSKRVYRVNGVRENPAIEEVFEVNNSRLNVVQYYKNFKNYTVRYPKLPCLWVGSLNNKIYVPIELCSILPGQVRNGKLTDDQTRNMIKYAADPPPERKRKIMEQYNHANFSNEYTNEFGISVAGEFEKVMARVLPAPQLSTNQEIRRGQWEVSTFQETKPLQQWCVVNMDKQLRSSVKDFKQAIMSQASRLGLKMDNPICGNDCIDCDPIREQNIFQTFSKLRSQNVQLAFVLIPDRGNVYGKVKKVSEIDVGLLTQCVKASTLKKSLGGPRGPNPSTFANILLKVNAKLNGTNHSLHPTIKPRCLKDRTMIIGADVTHSPPDGPVVPSVAAVAASFDQDAMQYHTVRTLQPSNVEVIQDTEEIMLELLRYFYKRRNDYPEKIIVFRDGVSEGQVEQVLHRELLAMRRACFSININYRPLITYLIVQKRHHTRFFPKAGGRGDENVPPGTCVDTQIVHPRDLDFYLVSHYSRLGTARPTKYKLIYDDSDMTEHELEILSYYLCHLIVRCTKSISYPAPTYYAHLAALRGRIHLSDRKVEMNSPRNERDKTITVKECFNNNPMFFV